MTTVLAEPTPEALELIRQHAPNGVVELGAGRGLWLEAMQQAGILCLGYDIVPHGPLVAFGDHISAARHKDLALLIVWPPDDATIATWINAWPGETLMICGSWRRFNVWLGDTLSDYSQVAELDTLTGYKGKSEFKIFTRKAS